MSADYRRFDPDWSTSRSRSRTQSGGVSSTGNLSYRRASRVLVLVLRTVPATFSFRCCFRVDRRLSCYWRGEARPGRCRHLTPRVGGPRRSGPQIADPTCIVMFYLTAFVDTFCRAQSGLNLGVCCRRDSWGECVTADGVCLLRGSGWGANQRVISKLGRACWSSFTPASVTLVLER